jgi:Peptidase family M28
MKKLIFSLLILRGGILMAQSADATTFAASITIPDLKQHEMVLTSDSLEGRETGTVGNQKAAAYIARYFEKLGLPKVGEDGTSYFQRMVYTNEGWNATNMDVNDKSYRHLFDFYALPSTNPDIKGHTIDASEVVFLGYGIDDARYSDYKKQNVKGKVILIYEGEPFSGDSVSLLTQSREWSEWTTQSRKKLLTAYKNGVKAVLIIDPKLAENIQQNRRLFSRSVIGDVAKPEGVLPNNVHISPDMVREIIGKKADAFAKARAKCADGKPRSLVLKTRVKMVLDKYFRQLIGNNVMGFVEGSDPVLKKEIVVVSAHYDHLGKQNKDIYRGADDNASGTSTVLEITQALMEAKKQGVNPKRSVLCMLVTGEEKGLLGSKYYVTHPVFPLEQTVADVNIDMVGRTDEKYKNNPNYIYVIGADKLSTELHEINEDMNKKHTNLTLDYTYNDENDPNRYYYRSDHYNFAERGIPAIFYFNGTHDDYHQPSDTMDKINFDKMTLIAKLAFHTAWEIANRADRLKVDKAKK